MLLSLLLLIVGFALLIKGADWLVDGAASVAARLGMPDLVIGLTIVAFGTSAPELLVNVIASINNFPDIVMGDVVGSNIANTLVVLGLAAILTPLAVQHSTVRKEIPLNILIGLALLFVVGDAFIDGSLTTVTRSEGMMLVCFFLIFLFYTFNLHQGGRPDDDEKTPKQTLPISFLLIAIGLILLPIGGHLVVSSAETIASSWGISDALIGLTIVALGTSLPEAAAAGVAAYKGKADIAIGNVVGSNIFNIGWVLGISAIIRPVVPITNWSVDLLIMVISSVFLFFLVHKGQIHHRLLFWQKRHSSFNLRRYEGALLIAAYVAYIGHIVWRG